MNIKNEFEKLSQRKIIQLYLIVLMTYVLLYIFHKDLSSLFYPVKAQNSLIVNTPIENHKIKRLTDLELLTYFNDTSKEKKISITEIKILKNAIQIESIGVFKNIIAFLNKTSRNFKIKRFEMNTLNNKIHLSIGLERDSFHISQLSRLFEEKLLNPFVINSANNKRRSSTIIISAIMDSEVLIDNTWYKQGDRLKQYLVLSIKKDKVVFVDTKTNKKIIKSINYE